MINYNKLTTRFLCGDFENRIKYKIPYKYPKVQVFIRL